MKKFQHRKLNHTAFASAVPDGEGFRAQVIVGWYPTEDMALRVGRNILTVLGYAHDYTKRTRGVDKRDVMGGMDVVL